MDEIWERAVETALAGQTEVESIRVLTLDGAVKCVKGHLPRPEILEKYPNLEHLSIANVSVSSLDRFPRLGKLQKLVLSDNRISGGLEFLVQAGLSSLRDLDLSNNRIGMFEDLLPLAELKLVSLDLYKCPVMRMKDYRARVFGLVKYLKYLDKMDAEENEIPESEDEEEEEENDDDDDDEDGDDDGEEKPDVISNGCVEGVVEVDEEESEADEDGEDGEERTNVMSNGHREGVVEEEESEADEDGDDGEERANVMRHGHSEGVDEEESEADEDGDDGEERANVMSNGHSEGVMEDGEEDSEADEDVDDGEERTNVMSNEHSEGVVEVDEEDNEADEDVDDGEERRDVMRNGHNEGVVEVGEDESDADEDGDDGEERINVMRNGHSEGVVEVGEDESEADEEETAIGRESNGVSDHASGLRDEHLNMEEEEEEEDDDDDSNEEDGEDEYEPDGLLVYDTHVTHEIAEEEESEEEMDLLLQRDIRGELGGHEEVADAGRQPDWVSGFVANGAQDALMDINREENDDSDGEDEYEPDGLIVDDNTHEIEEEDVSEGVEEVELGVQHGNELLRNILIGEIEHEQDEDDDESWEEEEEEDVMEDGEEKEEEYGTGGLAQSMAEPIQVDEEDSDYEVQIASNLKRKRDEDDDGDYVSTSSNNSEDDNSSHDVSSDDDDE